MDVLAIVVNAVFVVQASVSNVNHHADRKHGSSSLLGLD